MLRLSEDERLTTTQAGKLIGRSQDAVRQAINQGKLPAVNERGHWYIERAALIEWDKGARRHHFSRVAAWERSGQIIAEYGSVDADELARLAGIHIGNARKHLAILVKEGRVVRLADGQWALVEHVSEGVA